MLNEEKKTASYTNPQSDTLDRFLGCLLGLAVGDAVGTTVEFQQRGTFKPVTDMTGGGPLPAPRMRIGLSGFLEGARSLAGRGPVAS